MALFRVLARIFGWLLTPLVALAASFLGATASAALFADDDNPRRALILSLAGAAMSAVVVSWLWLRVLRRSPQVRQALALDDEGLPTGALFEESPGPADPAPRVPEDTTP
ncbi:MAG: hypothetical protein MUC69_11785 [Gemmatimonadales bacterium]|nr:hypothetical protein [Gemmatimonadales bacterium]